MQFNKHVEEKLIMKMFRDAYQDFPKGRLVKSESPDFFLREARKKKTGIELTRLHDGNHDANNPAEVMTTESYLVQKTSRNFYNKHNKPLLVKFFFNERPIEREDTDIYADFLSLYIEKLLDTISLKSLNILEVHDKLPDFLDGIALISHPDFKESCWSPAKNFLIYDLNRDILQNTINLKEEKLKLYQSRDFDKYWLVISTLKINPGKKFNIRNKIEKWSFQSGFDRILLYEILSNRVFELNTPGSE